MSHTELVPFSFLDWTFSTYTYNECIKENSFDEIFSGACKSSATKTFKSEPYFRAGFKLFLSVMRPA